MEKVPENRNSGTISGTIDLTEFIVQSELLEGGAVPLWYEIKASGMKDTTKIELNKGPEIPVKIVSYLII